MSDALVDHLDVPLEVRQRTDGLLADMERVRRALQGAAVLPAIRTATKKTLRGIATEARALSREI